MNEEKPYACNYGEKIPGEKPPQRKGFGFWKFDFKSTNVFVVLKDLDFEMILQERIQTDHNDQNDLLEIKFWFLLWWEIRITP